MIAAGIAGTLALWQLHYALALNWHSAADSSDRIRTIALLPIWIEIAVPAMVGGHALFIGWVECIATALVTRLLQKRDPFLSRMHIQT